MRQTILWKTVCGIVNFEFEYSFLISKIILIYLNFYCGFVKDAMQVMHESNWLGKFIYFSIITTFIFSVTIYKVFMFIVN